VNNYKVIKPRSRELAGYVARTGEMENANKILAEKLGEKRPLGRLKPTSIWKGKFIKMCLRLSAIKAVHCVQVGHDGMQ
jgi:hypothetical protein